MSWLHPSYLMLLVIVPLAVACFLWAAWQRGRAYRAFGNPAVTARLASGISARRRRWKGGLVALGLLFATLALAGPRFGTTLREVEREGVELVIALDVSSSMLAEDVGPNRLERARHEIQALLGQLHGDRVGLVLFAGDAFLQCPLTSDYGAVRLYLDVADPSLIPTPGTDYRMALETAIRAFESSDPERDDEQTARVLLIVSDGENHREEIDTAIEETREAGITIFSAGIGEETGAPIPQYEGGILTGYKRDREGNVVTTRLEEEVLRRLARGGAYFRIARTTSSLSQFPDLLTRLDRTVFASEAFETYDERYQWPLAIALLLLFADAMIPDSVRRRRKQVDE